MTIIPPPGDDGDPPTAPGDGAPAALVDALHEIERLRAEVLRLRRQVTELARAANAREYERPPHYS
jgi:hypothetical protein